MNWISVKDRLPDEELHVLIQWVDCNDDDTGYTMAVCYFNSDGWNRYGVGFFEEEVTHWMPLPDKPAEEG